MTTFLLVLGSRSQWGAVSRKFEQYGAQWTAVGRVILA